MVCLMGMDMIASVVIGVASAAFFSARYDLDRRARREMAVLLAVLSSPVRCVVYVLVGFIFFLFFEGLGLG